MNDMGYCLKRNYSLRWTDFDFQDAVKPSALLSVCQEAAGDSADELGFGYEELKEKGFGFIIVATYCEITGKITHGEEISVETWPLPPRHVIFERDYRVRNAKGERVAALASRWCLVDLNHFELQLPEALGKSHENCPYNPEKAVSVPLWKIPKLGDDGREAFRMTVGSSQCDHYLHANNTRYADFFLDCFGMNELSRPVGSFQIVYGKQAKEGAELRLFRKDCEDGTSICEARSDGEVLSQFRIRLQEKGENE